MIGVAFQGCACRAAFHAGVAAAFTEGGLAVALTAGASSGAICAAAIAAGHGASLPDMWRELSGRSVLSLRRALWNRSFFDMSHLVRNALRRHLGDGDLRAMSTEALVTATRARDLAPVLFSSREERDLVEPVLASCFIPVLYGRPVRVRGDYYLDGGVRDNLPIEALAARGVSDVIAVLPSHDGPILKSLRRRRWHPALASETSTPAAPPGPRLHIIRPARPLLLRSWDFDRDRMERAIDEGYARGREFLGR